MVPPLFGFQLFKLYNVFTLFELFKLFKLHDVNHLIKALYISLVSP